MKLSYQFHNKSLLHEALTHPSCKGNKNSVYNYERLEFFGDSILSMVISEFLFTNYKIAQDNQLSIMHSNLVNAQSLVKIAQSIDLGRDIIMDDGEEHSGGRENIKNLENAMEALIAAIYLDSDYATVSKIIIELWAPLLYDESIVLKDKKTILQEWTQKNNLELPIYEIITRDGPAHAPLFKVSVTVGHAQAFATGRSKKEAEQHAASIMIDQVVTSDEQQ